jgi:hypothetical protein
MNFNFLRTVAARYPYLETYRRLRFHQREGSNYIALSFIVDSHGGKSTDKDAETKSN